MSRSESLHMNYKENFGNKFGGNDKNSDFGGGNPPHSFGMVCGIFLIFVNFRGVLLP